MIEEINELFWNNSSYLLIYTLCIVMLLREKNICKKGRKMFLCYSIAVYIFLICNPLFIAIAFKFFFSLKEEYVRMFYILPIQETICYVITILFLSIMKQKKKILGIFILVVIVLISSNTFISQGLYVVPENIYKISKESLEISNIILEDCGGEADAVIRKEENANDSLYWGIRQYTQKIHLKSEIISGDDFDREYYEVFDDYWKRLEEEVSFDYVICDDNSEMCKQIEEKRFDFLGKSGGYVVYKRSD